MKTANLLALTALSVGIAAYAKDTRMEAASAAPGLSCQSSARAMARLEMLFGKSRPRGVPIADEEWISFLDTEVTPRFPDGLTVLQGLGQWRASNGRLTKEQSNILVIWHEPTGRTDADIEAIRAAYKQRFGQESVMRVDGASCVSF